jgi:hypothetical protein
LRTGDGSRCRDNATGFGKSPIDYSKQYTAAAPVHQPTAPDGWAHIVENDLEKSSIYDEQAELYGRIGSRVNRLVTLYDSKFDSLACWSISQFISPSEVAELKEINQDDEEWQAATLPHP